MNISSQLPLHKWDSRNVYFCMFKFFHALSILLKVKSVQRIPLTEHISELCFWAAFMHGLSHCFMLHRTLLAFNTLFFFSFLNLLSFRNSISDTQLFFVFLFNNSCNAAYVPKNSSFIPSFLENFLIVFPLHSFSYMKGPFLSLYMNHICHITYNVQLCPSKNEYSEVFILYFVCMYF